MSTTPEKRLNTHLNSTLQRRQKRCRGPEFRLSAIKPLKIPSPNEQSLCGLS